MRTRTVVRSARFATSNACGWRPKCLPTTTSPNASVSAAAPTTGGRAKGVRRARSTSETLRAHNARVYVGPVAVARSDRAVGLHEERDEVEARGREAHVVADEE